MILKCIKKHDFSKVVFFVFINNLQSLYSQKLIPLFLWLLNTFRLHKINLRGNATMPRKKVKKNEPSIKEKISEIFELPKEILLNLPKMVLLGDKQFVIENYKGIIEYEDYKIRVNTQVGIVKIEGINLNISEITSEDVLVTGRIRTIEFTPSEE